jgi:hypothetical protein
MRRLAARSGRAKLPTLANSRMSSNQSGDYPARSAMKTLKAKPQSPARQTFAQSQLYQQSHRTVCLLN